MCRNLFAIVLTSIAISASVPAMAQPTAASPSPAALSGLQPSSFTEHNKANAQHSAAQAELASLNPDTAPDHKPDSGWKYLTTLLTTLVLIGAIAVRRYAAGSH